MAMSCPRCNGQILDAQRFCRFCGYRLDHGVQDYTDTALFDQPSRTVGSAPGYAPQSAPWTPAPPYTPAPPVRRSRFWRRAITALIIFAVFGVAGKIAEEGIRTGWLNRTGIGRIAPGIVSSTPAYLGVYFDERERGGAFIDGIGPSDGPAAEAGLIGGDLIIEANDTPIKSAEDLRRFLRTKSPGDVIRLKYLRDQQEMETILTIGASDDFADERATGPRGFFGMNDGGATRARLPNGQIYGVRMDSLVRNGPADLAGIKKGDVIIAFNEQPIRTYRELTRRIREAVPRADVDVKVIRDNQQLVIKVRLGER